MAEQHEEEPATAAEVKRIIRRKLARVEEHTHQGLNIYPLMDVMTILLVFMIMDFAQQGANIVMSDELHIPYSNSEADVAPSLVVQVSRNQIIVDDRPVMSLRDGLVDPSQKQGGGNAFRIIPLFNNIDQHRQRLETIAQQVPTQPFTGEIQIIMDERTPYRTMMEVLYTLGQARFNRYHFVVLQQDS